MLGTSFAESMSKLVDEYLHKGNSIPAFLSAVTLELYGSGAMSDDDGEGDEDDEDDDDDDENDKDEYVLQEKSDSPEEIELDWVTLEPKVHSN